mmetsp:Transcript_39285/g.63795  ORF Transcript_39285/g.63795 Transcript_39285/m.63795 type:complete len:581 (+) Transcript_39285:201-1943(+)
MKAKHFCNGDGSACVEDMLQGLVRVHPGRLSLLDGYNVIVRSDVEQVRDRQVAIISGGGSGHEPAHAGFCGEGMLTAAVCGGVFASPGPESILATIRTVTGEMGCLLIVKNYTGDRLNFGLAAEKAKTEGYRVEIVFVADDAALEEKGVTGRRGLAGTVLVHKVAGAAASAGCSLEEVVAAAESVSQHVRTVGVSLSVCDLPGRELSVDRLCPNDGKMELGLGIHGEPGMATMDVMEANPLVSKLAEVILSNFIEICDKPPQRVAVLINDLGATTAMELYGLCNMALTILSAAPFSLKVERMYAGPFVTSLNMHGISMSLLALDSSPELFLQRLDAPTTAIGWHYKDYTFRGTCDLKIRTVAPKEEVLVDKAASDTCDRIRVSAEVGALISKRIRAAANELLAHKDKLGEYDSKTGDGDAGESFALGAKLVLAALDSGKIDTCCPSSMLGAIADETMRMGASSGACLTIFFHACELELMKSLDWRSTLQAATKTLTKYGQAKPGMRTMVDGFVALDTALGECKNLADIAARTLEGAQATAAMSAMAGRSNYVPESKLAGVPDPGAMAVAFAVKGMCGVTD